jgi:ABC-2 type transport system ATP-binding protein
MKMITGYLPPTDGTATVAGFDAQMQSLEVRRRLGYLPEANPLYMDMYVREYLELSAGIHKLGKDTKPRIDEMIQLTGLTKEAHKKIGALSKGYKQRVGLAQAMLHRPEVLILDEPTSGLDPNQIVEIRDLILQIGKEKTVLLSTHIMQEVQAMCSRVIIINSGNIVADDKVESLKQLDSREGAAILITFDNPVKEQQLRALNGMKSVQNLGDGKWRLYTANPDSLRKEILQLALQQDLSISSIQTETQSLEDVFRNLTTGTAIDKPSAEK